MLCASCALIYAPFPLFNLPFPFFLFQETTLYGCTVRINEPVGVVGIACPDEYPLLAFVSLFAPAVVRGNTIVIVPSERSPLSATDLYQVWWSPLPYSVSLTSTRYGGVHCLIVYH